MIVNNVAGLAGGGISLQDAVDVQDPEQHHRQQRQPGDRGRGVRAGQPEPVQPQPGAGVVSRVHSAAAGGNSGDDRHLLGSDRLRPATSSGRTGSSTSAWMARPAAPRAIPGCTVDLRAVPRPQRLAHSPAPAATPWSSTTWRVIGVAGTLAGLENLLTPDSVDGARPDGPEHPLFVAEYFNGARRAVSQTEITTAIQTPAAFDEGGNFIRPSYGPLSLYDDATAERRRSRERSSATTTSSRLAARMMRPPQAARPSDIDGRHAALWAVTTTSARTRCRSKAPRKSIDNQNRHNDPSSGRRAGTSN